MRYDPERHHRQSIRLKNYDYSQSGAYFLTICVHSRECLLSDIVDGTVVLSEVGQAVANVWYALPERFPGLVLDAIVFMPNHLHAILFLPGPSTKNPPVGALLAAPSAGDMHGHAAPSARNIDGDVAPGMDRPAEGAASSAPTSVTLGTVLRAFKSLAAREANRLLQRAEQPFWQRNYYERIIRDERELELTHTYIDNNPLQWETDSENPAVNTIM